MPLSKVTYQDGQTVIYAQNLNDIQDEIISQGVAKYEKPNSGIPKTDLASAVQTSLNKADTAVQLGLTGASVGDLARVAAVDANGKPTSWQKAPLCDITTNPNLLDNWYFVGGGSQLGDGVFPINQSGKTAYSSGNTIDRWALYSASNSESAVELSATGIRLYTVSGSRGSLRQYFKAAIDGFQVTLSVLTADGLLKFATAIVNTTSSGWQIRIDEAAYTAALRYVSGEWQLWLLSDNCTFKCVKLEIGAYQTLAHNEGTEANPNWVLNELPDFDEELAKCQFNGLRIENTFSGLEMFNRIGVIGDSFSSGGINPDGTSYQKMVNSWIQVIGRKLGIAATNYSRNGLNTTDFTNPSHAYYNIIGLGKLLSDITVKNTCGCYIFAMGINDAASGDSFLGTIADINMSDPSQNPNSFYGNMGKIISNIIQNAPDSKVIMSTFSRPTISASEAATYEAYNNAIISTANLFEVPYIDIRSDPYITSSYYINNQKNRHPTIDMYVGYANMIMRQCANCIVNNNAYFYNYRNRYIYNNTYYHVGEVVALNNAYMQLLGTAASSTELRLFIPFNKPIDATSFTITGGFGLRGGANSIAINGTIVTGEPTGNDCTLGNQYIGENGISFSLTFSSGVISSKSIYALQPYPNNPFVITFT